MYFFWVATYAPTRASLLGGSIAITQPNLLGVGGAAGAGARP